MTDGAMSGLIEIDDTDVADEIVAYLNEIVPPPIGFRPSPDRGGYWEFYLRGYFVVFRELPKDEARRHDMSPGVAVGAIISAAERMRRRFLARSSPRS